MTRDSSLWLSTQSFSEVPIAIKRLSFLNILYGYVISHPLPRQFSHWVLRNWVQYFWTMDFESNLYQHFLYSRRIQDHWHSIQVIQVLRFIWNSIPCHYPHTFGTIRWSSSIPSHCFETGPCRSIRYTPRRSLSCANPLRNISVPVLLFRYWRRRGNGHMIPSVLDLAKRQSRKCNDKVFVLNCLHYLQVCFLFFFNVLHFISLRRSRRIMKVFVLSLFLWMRFNAMFSLFRVLT